ncbi:MAG: SpoIIE family protein phosphatase [Anaerolineales bacterium]
MEKPPRILIVDDEPFNIDYVEQELEDLNYETSSAGNGREALEQVAKDPPDVILLDILMPEMDGFQVLRHLKTDRVLRNIPVIVVSALSDMQSIVKAVKFGAEDYLAKPFDPVLLKARLAASVGNKRLRDRELLYSKQMEQELELAWQVQSGFLPTTVVEIPDWQIAATLQQSRQTSGDFYDLIPLENGLYGILVADVAGKGMAAALYMVLSRTLIRTYSIQYPMHPEHVLSATNQRLLSDIKTGHFVTVFYGILDPIKGLLKYCNAGHNPPLHIKASATQDVRFLKRTGMILGVIEGEEWKQEQIQIDPGDSLLIYSDGVIDARNIHGKSFDMERLLQTLLANAGHPAQEIQDALLGELSGFVKNAPSFDDITLITITRDKGT